MNSAPSSEVVRVAITGAGVVTPVAIGVPQFADALHAGRQNLSYLEGVPIPRGKSAVGAIHDSRFDGMDRAYRMILAACDEAIAMRGGGVGGAETALIVSTLAADSESAEKRYAEFAAGPPFRGEMAQALRLFSNGAIPARLRERFGIEGACLTVSNACASGNIALGLALDMLRAGRCRRALVCGVELAKLTMIWGAERAGFVGRALRPFDVARDGSVLGEGAGAVIVEHPGDAPASVLGWIEGFGCGVDPGAAAITLIEDGSGLRRGMDLALRDAGSTHTRVTYVSAHAPGTPVIDRVECKAVRDLMGAHADDVIVNSTKSITSHMSAASAIVEVVAVLIQMRDGFVHGNAGLTVPDPVLQAPVCGADERPRTTKFALSNACGGGGLNTSVALSAADEPFRERAPEFFARKRRLAITGTGVVSPRGASAQFPSDAGAAEADRLDWFDVYQWYGKESQFGYMNRAAQLGAAAGFIALQSTDLSAKYEPDRIAVLSGTLLGGTPESFEILCRALHEDANSLRPSMALDHGIHLAASLIRRAFGFYGLSYTLTGSGSSGLLAVQVAADALLANRAAAAVVVASDSLDAALCRARAALNGCFPEGRLSEGAGAVAIEETDSIGRVLSGWSTFSLPKTRAPDVLQGAAERIARQMGGARWAHIYCTGSAAAEARGIASALAGGASLESAMPEIYCMSATPMFALCAATGNAGASLVLSVERDGVVAAIGIEAA
jgi:3-oxoacyl-[acyl-carrier-protein] synthase II